MRRLFVATAVVVATAAGLTANGVASETAGPGATITASNKDAVAGLLPKELSDYVIKDYDGLSMKIKDTQSYMPHPKFVQATKDHACKATLDAKGMIQNYVAGQPFPYSEWAKEATGHKCDLTPDDPQFALKLAWNVNFRWQGPGLNIPHFGFSYMRNGGKETWRVTQGEYRRTYFSHRADLLPATSDLEPNTDVEWAEFFDVKTPFDLRGTMFLLYRYNDVAKEDQTFAYIPALRRVRRVSATQKADSLLGTEFTLEDFYLFAGYVWNHTWEAKGENTYLGNMHSERTCFPSVISQEEALREEGQTRLGNDQEWNACKWGPFGALPFADETWQKRTVFQLDDVPQREGHPYSRKKLWYDKETMQPLYALAYDRAGNPFRIITTTYKWSENSAIPANKGQNVLNVAHIMVVNVQNGNSHVGQFDNSNARVFAVEASRQYYDTSRLKKQGR
jgi:hypothetical protein